MQTSMHLQKNLSSFAVWLCKEGKSCGTIEKYRRDLRAFAGWLNGCELTNETAIKWRERLLSDGYAPITVNSMLAAVNTYCVFAELNIRIRFLKIQRQLFREQSRELTKEEFNLLVQTA